MEKSSRKVIQVSCNVVYAISLTSQPSTEHAEFIDRLYAIGRNRPVKRNFLDDLIGLTYKFGLQNTQA